MVRVEATAELVRHAAALADAVDAALPRWVERCVLSRLPDAGPAVRARVQDAGERARLQVGGAVRQLLLQDVDEQRANPLALLREAVRYPTEVLRAEGAPPAERDDFARDRFPDDDYDLTPATWADLDPGLAGLGITWGAAKAFVHRQRHAS